MDDLLNEAKQFLSIIEDSTIKDEEIKMLIDAAKLELQRVDINIKGPNSLVKTAIMMFVKANFGNVSIKEKELAQRTFNSLEQCLSLSDEYKRGSGDNESN